MMATAAATVPVNGNHAPENQTDLSKEEVGWYFVEQYYTTLSRDPQKLWLYYNKRSQHVSGVEEEKVPVCIGQKHIKDRISELNFSNSKVRITNVDAQSSDDNILIQVLGDIAFSDASPRHFVQSFVLSKQPNGYFVLNDIFRYIKEEVEEEIVPEQEQEEGTSLEEPAPTAANDGSLVKPEDSVADEKHAAVVDQELEKIKAEEPKQESTSEVNGTPAEPAQEKADEPAPVEPESEIKLPTEDPAAEIIDEAADLAAKAAHDEKPVETTESSAQEPAASSAPKPAASAPKPAIPKTWASMAASANRVAMPNLPSSSKPSAQQPRQASSSTSATETQPKSATTTAAAPPSAAPIPSNATVEQPSSSTPPGVREGSPDSAGWQSVGPDHSRKQSRTQTGAKQDESVRAYIKNVNTISTDDLTKTLSKFGSLEYVDIDTAKSCAFVTFRTSSGFQAAVRANPHHIGDDEIFVEERKTRAFGPGGAGGPQRGNARGGRGGSFGGAAGDRGGRGGGRGGAGGFPPRGGRGAGGPVGGRGTRGTTS